MTQMLETIFPQDYHPTYEEIEAIYDAVPK